MMALSVRTENRRFLLSLGAAVLVHLALGAALSVAPRGEPAAEREYQTVRVTFSPGAEAESAKPTNNSAEGPAQLEAAGPLPEADAVPAQAEANTEAAGPLPEADAPAEAGDTASPPDDSTAPAQREAAPKTVAQTAELAAPEVPEAPEAPAQGETTTKTVAEATTPAAPEAPGAAAKNNASDEVASGTAEPRRNERSLGQASLSEAAAPAPYAFGVSATRSSTAGGPTTRSGSGSGDTPTIEPTRYVAPEYPEQARRAGRTGTVVVELTVGRRGRVETMELIESSGYAPLDEAAMRAVRLWRFPRDESGERSLHRFEFTLE